VRSGWEARAPSPCVAGSLGSDGEGVLGPTVPIGFHQLPDAMKWQALAPRIFRKLGDLVDRADSLASLTYYSCGSAVHVPLPYKADPSSGTTWTQR
jgi:hypothetical protein